LLVRLGVDEALGWLCRVCACRADSADSAIGKQPSQSSSKHFVIDRTCVSWVAAKVHGLFP
jgi:hypothetical protein